jgi:hypothetical protein
MAGCGWRTGLSLVDAGPTAATLDNVTNPVFVFDDTRYEFSVVK